MEYNDVFLDELCNYIADTVEKNSEVGNTLIKNMSSSVNDKFELMQDAFSENANIVKLLDFCNKNDDAFNFDIDALVKILGDMNESTINYDFIGFFDTSVFEMNSYFSNAFECIDGYLANKQ